jgi:hypothetical protein
LRHPRLQHRAITEQAQAAHAVIGVPVRQQLAQIAADSTGVQQSGINEKFHA